jgi:hypothetical protein
MVIARRVRSGQSSGILTSLVNGHPSGTLGASLEPDSEQWGLAHPVADSHLEVPASLVRAECEEGRAPSQWATRPGGSASDNAVPRAPTRVCCGRLGRKWTNEGPAGSWKCRLCANSRPLPHREQGHVQRRTRQESWEKPSSGAGRIDKPRAGLVFSSHT